MKRRLLAVLYLAASGTVLGIVGGVASLTPEQKAIHSAASITDAKAREFQLREALRAGLFAPDPQTRDSAFRYVAENVRWIDLRPYGDLLEAFSKVDDLHYRALWLLDQSELMRAPKGERESVYRRAIADGAVNLPHSWSLTRRTALSLASLDGIAELVPLIDERLTDAWPDERERLLPAAELRAGGADRAEGARLAAGRLVVMGDEEFVTRMDEASGFRAAVLEVGAEVCAVNPFSGARNPGCLKMRELVQRQVALDTKERQSVAVSSLSHEKRAESVSRREWLDRLKGQVP